MKRITLCKTCHDSFYPELKLPEGVTAIYLATGYCSNCKKRTTVKTYAVNRPQEESKTILDHNVKGLSVFDLMYFCLNDTLPDDIEEDED